MKRLTQKIKEYYLTRKIFKQAKEVALDKDEKKRGQRDLIAFMEEHPVRNNNAARRNLQRSTALSGLGKLQLTYSTKTMSVLLTIALLFSLGGGVSFAAQDALPNETLYPVKIHVNERVESAFAINEEAKTELALERTELRLREVEELAVRGDLDEETTARIETRLNSQIERLEDLRNRLEEKGNEDAATQIQTRIEAMLQVHERVLAQLENRLSETDDAQHVTKIKSRVNTAMQTTMRTRAHSEAEVSAEGNTENREQAALSLQKVAKAKLEKTTEFKNRIEARIQNQVKADAEAQLTEAQELLLQGEVYMEEGNYQEAFLTFHKSLRSTQQAHSLIATSVHLGIDIDARADTNTKGNNGNNDTNSEIESEVDAESSIETETETEIKANTSKQETNATLRSKAKARIGF